MTGLFSKSGKLRHSGVTVMMDITQEDDSARTWDFHVIFNPSSPTFFPDIFWNRTRIFNGWGKEITTLDKI